MTETLLAPDIHVPAGACVAIVAPGGYAPDEAAVARGIALLEAQGCKVKSYYDHAARHQRFGATDAGQQAAADPEVQVVIALRGAYGMSRILPVLNYEALAASGKLFVGYSDITALHLALLAQTGAPPIGPSKRLPIPKCRSSSPCAAPTACRASCRC
nr:LD-carboxypeptidase [Herbaspirillum lusitanum]